MCSKWRHNHDHSHRGGNVLSRQASDNQFMVSWRKQPVACVESLMQETKCTIFDALKRLNAFVWPMELCGENSRE